MINIPSKLPRPSTTANAAMRDMANSLAATSKRNTQGVYSLCGPNATRKRRHLALMAPGPAAGSSERQDHLQGSWCVYYSVSVENDLRCAIHTPGPMAQANAQVKAQANAQVIFPRTSVTPK